MIVECMFLHELLNLPQIKSEQKRFEVNKQVLFLDLWFLLPLCIKALRRAFRCWLLERDFFFFLVMLLQQKFLQIRRLLFLVSPCCCFSHIYLSVTVWGQLGWKLWVGRRESAGFNYQLSKSVVLVCAHWLRWAKTEKKKKGTLMKMMNGPLKTQLCRCLKKEKKKDSTGIKS